MKIITQSNEKTTKDQLKNNKFIVRKSLQNSELNRFRGKKEKPNVLYGARPFIHFYPSGELSLHLFGVKIQFRTEHKPTNHGNSFDGETETMSKNSRVRLLKKTSALEFLGQRPTHMLTLTVPPERFEILTNDEKISVWKFAKSFFLRKLQKILVIVEGKALWFQEFQERGAPHLHVLLSLKWLNDTEWEEYLDRFILAWEKALKWDMNKDFPTQSIEFKAMKKKDFRYARKYASKLEQKNAPFRGKWGKWWGATGDWRKVKGDKEINIELPREVEKNVFAIREDMNWIAWDRLKEIDEKLYGKIKYLIKNGEPKKEKWTMEKVEFMKLMQNMKGRVKRREIAEIRLNAFYEIGHRGNGKFLEWAKKYPFEQFESMTDISEVQTFFNGVIEQEKQKKKQQKHKESTT